MGFNQDIVLVEKNTGHKFKILSIREIWIDIYNIKSGEIRTLCAGRFRDDFEVYTGGKE